MPNNTDENITEEKDTLLSNEQNTHSETGSLEQDQSLKNIIRILKELTDIAKTYSFFLAIPVVLMALYGFYKSKQVKPTYTAKITFFLSEDRPQIPGFGGGNFSNILQTTNNNFNNPKKLKEYAFTEKVGSKLLFKKYYFRGKEDYLANHYLNLFNNLQGSFFKDFTNVKDLNTQDYLIFKRILGGIRQMVTVDYNEAEIYSITVTTGDEEFSKLLCEAFYENVIAYYIERATGKAKITVDFLEEKLALVKAQLENSEYNLADYKDKANNLITFKADLIETRYIRNKSLLEALYAESARGLEAAKTNYQSILPLFSTIDEPHLPLQKNVTSTLNQTLMFIGIGFFLDLLIIAFIYFRTNYWVQLKSMFKSA